MKILATEPDTGSPANGKPIGIIQVLPPEFGPATLDPDLLQTGLKNAEFLNIRPFVETLIEAAESQALIAKKRVLKFRRNTPRWAMWDGAAEFVPAVAVRGEWYRRKYRLVEDRYGSYAKLHLNHPFWNTAYSENHFRGLHELFPELDPELLLAIGQEIHESYQKRFGCKAPKIRASTTHGDCMVRGYPEDSVEFLQDEIEKFNTVVQ